MSIEAEERIMPKKSEKRNEKTSFSSDQSKSMSYATNEYVQREQKEFRNILIAFIGVIIAVFFGSIALLNHLLDKQFESNADRIKAIEKNVDEIKQSNVKIENKIDRLGDRLDRLIDRKTR